ncbi:hypothetical protein [Acidocella sp.]|uniref:hypothetical protein n=1 Tax=Acidocella sp. TaxID=50710 RepID=UPI00260AB3E5|nr:hypothetical protein [Acidocella sp.]
MNPFHSPENKPAPPAGRERDYWDDVLEERVMDEVRLRRLALERLTQGAHRAGEEATDASSLQNPTDEDLKRQIESDIDKICERLIAARAARAALGAGA